MTTDSLDTSEADAIDPRFPAAHYGHDLNHAAEPQPEHCVDVHALTGMDKATPTTSPATVDSVMELVREYASLTYSSGMAQARGQASGSSLWLEQYNALRAEVERLAAQAAQPEPPLSVARIAHIGEGESPVISLVWHVATKDLETRGVTVDALLYVQEPQPSQAPVAQPEQAKPEAKITEPYTLEEIKARIATDDYNAELLLQHAMLLLDVKEGRASGVQAQQAPAPQEAPTDAQMLDFIAANWFYLDGEGVLCFGFNEAWDGGCHPDLRSAIRAAITNKEVK